MFFSGRNAPVPDALVVVSATVQEPALGFLREAAAEDPGLVRLDIRPGEDITARTRAVLAHGGFSRVLAVGGDGTASAVAAVAAEAGIPLGIVPGGTGNVIAKDLGVPVNPADAIRAALDPKAVKRPVDAFRANGRFCLLNAGIGVNAATAGGTPRLGKTLFGRTAYVSTTVLKILEAKPHAITLVVDGVPRPCGHMTDLLVSNCGGLARVLHPHTRPIRPDDGWLDIHVVILRDPIEYPWYYLRRWFFPNRVYRIVHEFRARRTVRIEADEPLAAQADGDVIGTTPLEVRLLPRAVTVLLPRKS